MLARMKVTDYPVGLFSWMETTYNLGLARKTETWRGNCARTFSGWLVALTSSKSPQANPGSEPFLSLPVELSIEFSLRGVTWLRYGILQRPQARRPQAGPQVGLSQCEETWCQRLASAQIDHE